VAAQTRTQGRTRPRSAPSHARGTHTHTQNLKTVSSPSFFLRIAGMSDETKDESRKEQLSVLADNVVATLEAVMQRTEERMDGAAELVQGLIASAAEENGEFIVPLKPERVKFMRNKVALARAQIDEGILSTVFAYMKKANEVRRQPTLLLPIGHPDISLLSRPSLVSHHLLVQDGLDGMVVIFQKLLQLWAAEELVAAGAGNAVLERLLLVDEEEWSGILAAAIEAGETDAEAMQAAVQGCVERVVLQQASGSYGQRVQAEFLRELLSRLRKEPASTDEAK
jgi:hypothetical protein